MHTELSAHAQTGCARHAVTAAYCRGPPTHPAAESQVPGLECFPSRDQYQQRKEYSGGSTWQSLGGSFKWVGRSDSSTEGDQGKKTEIPEREEEILNGSSYGDRSTASEWGGCGVSWEAGREGEKMVGAGRGRPHHSIGVMPLLKCSPS